MEDQKEDASTWSKHISGASFEVNCGLKILSCTGSFLIYKKYLKIYMNIICYQKIKNIFFNCQSVYFWRDIVAIQFSLSEVRVREIFIIFTNDNPERYRDYRHRSAGALSFVATLSII